MPILTWVMFLKFLDDMEQIREEEAKMSGKRFRPALDSPYRWRDWAAKAEGITGDDLIGFVNNEEAIRPDGTKGAGLFAYLRSLQGANGGDRLSIADCSHSRELMASLPTNSMTPLFPTNIPLLSATQVGRELNSSRHILSRLMSGRRLPQAAMG